MKMLTLTQFKKALKKSRLEYNEGGLFAYDEWGNTLFMICHDRGDIVDHGGCNWGTCGEVNSEICLETDEVSLYDFFDAFAKHHKIFSKKIKKALIKEYKKSEAW